MPGGRNNLKDDWYASLPRKRIGTGVLLLNQQDELLIVKPCYKPHWSIPGGVVDEQESPWQACQREIQEEIGLQITRLKLLSVAWTSQPDRGEGLQFLFCGPQLSIEQISAIVTDPSELEDARFVPADQAIDLLGEPLRFRVQLGLEHLQDGKVQYLEQILDGTWQTRCLE